jgi:hypothetical protein
MWQQQGRSSVTSSVRRQQLSPARSSTCRLSRISMLQQLIAAATFIILSQLWLAQHPPEPFRFAGGVLQ